MIALFKKTLKIKTDYRRIAVVYVYVCESLSRVQLLETPWSVHGIL